MNDGVSKTEATGAERYAWLGWAAQVLGLLFAIYVLWADVGEVIWGMRAQAGQGSIGAFFATEQAHDGWIPVETLAPGGTAARAGLEVGEPVRFDRSYDMGRHRLRAGEAIGISVKRSGRTEHRVLIVQPRSTAWDPHLAPLTIYNMVTMLVAAFGAFIIWRSRRKPTTLALGAGLVTYGLISAIPPFLLSTDPVLYTLSFWIGVINLAAVPIFFYGFAVRFYVDNVGPAKPYEIGVFGAYAAIQLCLGAVYGTSIYHVMTFPVVADGGIASVVVSYAGFVLCLVYLVRGWRRSAADVQQRYGLMLIAASAIIAAQSLDLLTQLLHFPDNWFAYFHLYANSLLSGVIASGLFTYSILRHRVFDLGFAVNRTLVYGVVSAIMLVGFGLVEWASDHYLPIAGLEKNAIVDAVVALAIFLTFHRLRDAVEHGVESLFFRSWREKEAALKTYVGEAAYILKPKALTRSFVHALVRFADGSPVAVYQRDEVGQYSLQEGLVGAVPPQIDPDHPALVALRARRAALEHDDLPDMGAAQLALPMVNRAEVTGFVLVGAKPSGLAFRPDEVELLSWAVNQVGLDLHTLRIEQLEAVAAEQRQEIALLRARDGLLPAAG